MQKVIAILVLLALVLSGCTRKVDFSADGKYPTQKPSGTSILLEEELKEGQKELVGKLVTDYIMVVFGNSSKALQEEIGGEYYYGDTSVHWLAEDEYWDGISEYFAYVRLDRSGDQINYYTLKVFCFLYNNSLNVFSIELIKHEWWFKQNTNTGEVVENWWEEETIKKWSPYEIYIPLV
jgi:hypothetical protein